MTENLLTLNSSKAPILKYLHWLKVNERIEYKLLSLTYIVRTTAKPIARPILTI